MENPLQVTDNLLEDATKASRLKVPLLLIFTQGSCSFCELLIEEVIQPMLKNEKYRQRVLIREFMIDDIAKITGFDGQPVAPMTVFQDYGLYVTPSVLLVDGQGREIAARQIGINTVDYYGYYLDEAINQALSKINPSMMYDNPFRGTASR